MAGVGPAMTKIAARPSSQIMPRIRAVERLIAEREVGDDVAFDCGLEQRPLEPGRVAQVAASDATIAIEAQPRQDVAAKSFRERHAFAGLAGELDVGVDIALRQPVENLIDQRQTLLDLADADPHARIDVAGFEHRYLERQ